MIKGRGRVSADLKSFFTGIDTPTRKILVRIERGTYEKGNVGSGSRNDGKSRTRGTTETRATAEVRQGSNVAGGWWVDHAEEWKKSLRGNRWTISRWPI